MKNDSKLRVLDIVGSPICVSADDGLRVHKKISHLFEQDRHVRLSFDGVEVVIPAFLNVAIGQLYGKYPEELICKKLRIQEMKFEYVDLLNQVVKNAKAYLRYPAQYDHAWNEVVGDDGVIPIKEMVIS